MLTIIHPRKNNHNPNATFKKLDEYLLDAKKQIIYFCKKSYPSYLTRLVNDEEVISLVAYANMLADWRYDPNNLASRNTFANGYAFGFIQQIIKKIKKESKRKNVDISELYEIYDKKECENRENLIKLETIENIMSKIPPRFGAVIKKHYLLGKTFDEISQEEGISRQRVHQIVKVGLRKAKECVNLSN